MNQKRKRVIHKVKHHVKTHKISSFFILCGLIAGMYFAFNLSGQAAIQNATFNNASSWDILYSRDMPLRPAPYASGGWYFDFPKQGGYVGYVTTNYTQPIDASSRLTLTAKMETTGTPTFSEPSSYCNVPGKARLYIQRKGMKPNTTTHKDYRWWSNPKYIEMKQSGLTTINVPLTPSDWSNAAGELGSKNPAAFNYALANVEKIGVTFGSCSGGHGLFVTGGTARFIVTNYGFTSAIPPYYLSTSIVNSATSLPVLSSKTWTTVYGTNLIKAPSCKSSPTLVTSLCGTYVKINGKLAQMNYAGKTQVNFLMPDVSGAVTFELVSEDGSGGVLTLNVKK